MKKNYNTFFNDTVGLGYDQMWTCFAKKQDKHFHKTIHQKYILVRDSIPKAINFQNFCFRNGVFLEAIFF